MIIPTLSEGGRSEMARARAKGQLVFHRILEPMPLVICPNCQDLGRNIISIAKAGPFRWPPRTSQAVTWFEGDGQVRSGWFIVDTKEFPCPQCQATGLPPEVKSQEGSNATQEEIPF